MGDLNDFDQYIRERTGVVEAIEAALVHIQERYETYFQEIARVRGQEIEQLAAALGAHPEQLDPMVRAEVNVSFGEQSKKFDQELAAVRESWTAARDAAEAQRVASQAHEEETHRLEVNADASEEAFKARVEALRQRMEEYNARIRQMSEGFGFFSNFFRARDLMRERHLIVEEQTDVVARIEKLRAEWSAAESGYEAQDEALKAKWRELQGEAATAKTKLDYLTDNRQRIVMRTVAARLVEQRKRDTRLGVEGEPPCPRCTRPNPVENFFCAYCAARMGQDRPDAAGSLLEVAELNQHFEEFQNGMRSCQEIIALVRGLRSGLASFEKSVQSMIDSQTQHGLKRLQLMVPPPSVSYGQEFDRLRELVSHDTEALHPVPFAARIGELIEGVFTAERIQEFFEILGQELSCRAEEQW